MTELKRWNRREVGIDALRGGAVVAVMLYHYHPFGPGLTDYGIYGVTLFFMISGYCMLPSLRSSSSLRHFLAKRVARLLPALVICGFLSTVVERVTLVRPDRLHGFADWIKSSVCLPTVDIPCQLSGFFLGKFHEYSYPDGAYWTLATEFKFYLFIGLVYWVLSYRHAIAAFAVLLFGAQLFWSTGLYIRYIDEILPYLPVFLAGAAISEFTRGNRATGLLGMGASAVVLAVMCGFEIKPYSMPVVTDSALLAYALCFTALLAVARFPVIAANPVAGWLAFVGAFSYPLYLLHQDIGLVLLEYLRAVDGVTVRLFVLPGIMVMVAFAVHRTIEYRWQSGLTRLLVGTPLDQPMQEAT